MPWFHVDDSAHTHPKILKAGNAALGLWMRCGAHAAQHLTDGIVPGPVAAMYGTAPQIRKLVAAGLWHERDHACSRCPQPTSGDFVMHDYTVCNPTRAKVLADRRKAAEKKREQRAGTGQRHDSSAGSDANRSGMADESGSIHSRNEDESSAISQRFANEFAGQGDMSPGDSLGTRARASAPTPAPLPPTEVVGACKQAEPVGVPDELQPLRDALAAHPDLAGTAWGIRKHSDWQRIREAVRRVGVPAMVTHALNASRTRGAPAYVTAWIRGWEGLANQQPPPEQGAFLLAIPGGGAPASRTDQRIAAGLALADRLEAEERQAR